MAARGVAVRKKVLNAADNRFRIQNSMAGNMFPQWAGVSEESVQRMLLTIQSIEDTMGTLNDKVDTD